MLTIFSIETDGSVNISTDLCIAMAKKPETGKPKRLQKRAGTSLRDATTAWLTPCKAAVILLVVIVGLLQVIEVPSISIQVKTEGDPTKSEVTILSSKTTRQKQDSTSNEQDEQGLQLSVTEPPKQKDYGPLLTDSIVDPWKRSLYNKLDQIREACGELCRINDMETYRAKAIPKEGAQFSTFRVPVDCRSLFEEGSLDDEDKTLPFPIPSELEPFFSLSGAIPVENFKRFQGPVPIPQIDFTRFHNVKLGGRAMHNTWTREEIESGVQLLKNGELRGSYGLEETNRVFQQILKEGGLHGKVVLVVGSESSWLETTAIAAGAEKVITIEYGMIRSLHPQLKVMTPAQFRQGYLSGELPQFDAVLSYSSLDHSGLGRYGEILNPWGDIVSLARCWCVTKDEGMLMLAMPTGNDKIKFNSHRIYGNIRWPLVSANWDPIDAVTDFTQKTGESIEAIHFFRKASF